MSLSSRVSLRPFSLALLLAISALWSLHLPVHAAQVVDRIVVTVNNDTILESDIDKFRDKMRSKSYRELFGGIDDTVLKDRNAVLQLLVEERLINQQVKKLELEASSQEIDGQIRSIAKRNGITSNQLTERLKQLGTSIADYRDAIKRQLERKNLMDREIKPSMEVSEEQLRHFYQRNASAEDSEVHYKIGHILIQDRTRDGVTGAARAKKIYEEVVIKPAEFNTLVAQYSDDASSVESGGLIGEFSPSQLSKEFRSIIPKTAVGSVTSPIKTGSGYHIVKVLEKKVGDFASLPKERKEMLRNEMLASELEKKMGLWLERKKADSTIKVFNASK